MASLILRIVSLFMGRLTLVKRESLARHRTAKQRHILTQIGWPDAPESVTGSDWNEWPDQIGIPGRITPECANPAKIGERWKFPAGCRYSAPRVLGQNFISYSEDGLC